MLVSVLFALGRTSLVIRSLSWGLGSIFYVLGSTFIQYILQKILNYNIPLLCLVAVYHFVSQICHYK